MLSPEAVARIARFVDEELEPAERAQIVAEMETSTELQGAVHDYNWDDGFAIPTAIADHPACDLGLALQLFWLADGIEWVNRGGVQDPAGSEWATFCTRLWERVLAGRYAPGENGFDPGLGRVGLHTLRKQGLPEIFYTAFDGKAL